MSTVPKIGFSALFQKPLTFKNSDLRSFVWRQCTRSMLMQCSKTSSVAVNLVLSLTVTMKVVFMLHVRLLYSCCFDDCLHCRVSDKPVSFLELSFFISQA